MDNQPPSSPARGSTASGSSPTSPGAASASGGSAAYAAVGPQTAATNLAGRLFPHAFAPNPGAAMFSTWRGTTRAPSSSGAFASLVAASSATYAPAVLVAATATPGMRTRHGTAPDAEKSRLARFGRALVAPITKHTTPKPPGTPAHSAIASVAAVASAVGASSARPVRPLPAPVRPLTAPARTGEISVSAVVPGSFVKEEDPEWVKQLKRDAGIEVDGGKGEGKEEKKGDDGKEEGGQGGGREV